MVFVSRTVAVFHNNPNAGVSVGVRDVVADLEQLVHAAVKERGSDDVVSLVHLVGLGQSVNRHVRQTTEVNHRRVAARRRDIVGTVACVAV